MATTCPRCGGALERYEMWGREQFSCGDCGYVGVPVDHVSDREAPESWGEAIRRFQASDAVPGPTESRGGPTTVPEVPEDADASPTVEVVPGGADPGGGATEGDADDARGDGADDDGSAESVEGEDTAADERDADDAGDGDETDAGNGAAGGSGGGSDRRSALRRRKKKRER